MIHCSTTPPLPKIDFGTVSAYAPPSASEPIRDRGRDPPSPRTSAAYERTDGGGLGGRELERAGISFILRPEKKALLGETDSFLPPVLLRTPELSLSLKTRGERRPELELEREKCQKLERGTRRRRPRYSSFSSSCTTRESSPCSLLSAHKGGTQ